MSELEAGRELDALIAEKVMGGRLDSGGYLYSHIELPTGWLLGSRNRIRYGDDAFHVYENALPRYSTDIAAAWTVLEKLIEGGRYFPEVHYMTDGEWRCELRVSYDQDPRDIWEDATTAPLAICRAALAATEAKP